MYKDRKNERQRKTEKERKDINKRTYADVVRTSPVDDVRKDFSKEVNTNVRSKLTELHGKAH